MGAGVLRLPNAEVIVDNGVLRTAADAGLSRIWVEIYGGGKMAGRVEKLERCEHEGEKKEVRKDIGGGGSALAYPSKGENQWQKKEFFW